MRNTSLEEGKKQILFSQKKAEEKRIGEVYCPGGTGFFATDIGTFSAILGRVKRGGEDDGGGGVLDEENGGNPAGKGGDAGVLTMDMLDPKSALYN
jgi:hypothetical protein